MTSPAMPMIWRTNKRYSDVRRPAREERCIFSHAELLIPGEFVEKARAFCRDWIENGKQCVVLRNASSFVEVMFDGASESDYVPAEFLMKRELTAFGRAFFDRHVGEMSPRIRKYFL